MNSKEKKSAESKHMEAKQYAIKQPIDQRRNKKVVKRYWEKNANENMRIQTYMC